jgi:hypothetical protein
MKREIMNKIKITFEVDSTALLRVQHLLEMCKIIVRDGRCVSVAVDDEDIAKPFTLIQSHCALLMVNGEAGENEMARITCEVVEWTVVNVKKMDG